MYPGEFNTPKSELDLRNAKLLDHLVKNSIDGALIMQRADLFYFTGTIQQAHLYIPVDDKPILMVYKSSERAAAESTLDRIISLTSPKQIPDLLLKRGYRPLRMAANARADGMDMVTMGKILAG